MLDDIKGDFHQIFIPDEAALMLRSLVESVSREHMLVADLGTGAGYSSLVMLPAVAANRGMVYSVDWFRGSPGASGPAGEGGYGCGTILGAAFNNVRDNGYLDNWRLYAGNSDEAADFFDPGVFDLVYVAADHRYTAVMKDISAWVPKLRPGGIICGHQFEEEIREGHELYQHMLDNLEEDYVNLHHYGLIHAVQQCFRPFMHKTGIWCATKEWYRL